MTAVSQQAAGYLPKANEGESPDISADWWQFLRLGWWDFLLDDVNDLFNLKARQKKLAALESEVLS